MLQPELASAKILIVDDEEANVRLLERVLTQAGYSRLESTTDSRDVTRLYGQFRPDLILLDLRMPHPDGFAVMAELERLIPGGSYVPILVLTADVTREATRRALAAGANDFLTKPFDYQEVVLRIRNLLLTRFLHVETVRQNAALEARVRERTRRLLQSEKLAAMGQLLAGVAHELNNPLAVVLGQAMLLHHGSLGPPWSGRVEKILRAADRCVQIVKSFLGVARDQPPVRQRVDLNTVVREAMELLAHELQNAGVEVRFDLGADLPAFAADPHQLHQVVVNLVANAYQAMRAPSPPPRLLTLTTRVDHGAGRIRLTVADTGPGMSAELQERIFEPFFTTKPTGQGTGLGLSLSAGVVADHGGTLTVQSEPGWGATFVVELPVHASPGPSPENGEAPATGSIGPRRVLVVDDEPEVADLLVDMLALDGHEVDTAINGAEALEKVASRRYDFVLSDTKMPVLDGIAFYEELLRRQPDFHGRVAFVTGDALSAEKREFFEREGVPSLSKPFSLGEIRRIVHILGRA